jgi:hypothetical protein
MDTAASNVDQQSDGDHKEWHDPNDRAGSDSRRVRGENAGQAKGIARDSDL